MATNEHESGGEVIEKPIAVFVFRDDLIFARACAVRDLIEALDVAMETESAELADVVEIASNRRVAVARKRGKQWTLALAV